MLKISHTLTPKELGTKTIRQRQQEVNRAILRSFALHNHRRFHGEYPRVFGQIACTQPAHSFKKAVHEIYAAHGLTLHEFRAVKAELQAA